MTETERAAQAAELRSRARVVEEMAESERRVASEWSSTALPLPYGRHDDEIYGRSARSALSDAATAMCHASDAKANYARELRRRADQIEEGR